MTVVGETRQPLSASWREWIASPNWKNREWHGDAWDAIVIGSGYGGSVAVLRLAQKGYRVLLLERGSEYLPGEFPNDFSLAPKFFRVNVPGQGLPAGRASGLIEVHLGQGMVAVTGNGLGGGSLVNAGVVLKPDHDVFAQRHWPAAIRHAPAAGLDPFFEKAAKQLEARTWSSALPGGFTLHKSAALDRLAQGLQRQASPVDVTIDPARCMRCGDCAAGCNVEGAKRSLGETYLREALATGRVQVVTQAEVYRFEQHTDALYAHAGWRVHAFATDAQQHYAATQEAVSDWQAGATTRTLSAPMLFVCAGTFGSTQLLQRSQAVAGEQLAFSPTLGTRLSGNGDSISAVGNEEESVNAVGRGARGFTAWKLAKRGKRYYPAQIVGPTITTKIDLRAPGPHDDAVSRAAGRLPLERRLVVEDAAIPRAIAQVFREVLATGATLKALDGWWFPRPRYVTAHSEDPLAASDARAQHAQVLLVMGHDGSPGRIVWLQGLDRSAPYVPHPQDIPTYREQQKLFDRMGGRHVHNPLWQAMPADAVQMMSGPKPEPVITTVHPLGGCVMSDDPAHGVVNDLGQVWVHDPGRGFLNPDAMELPAGVPCSAAFRNEPRLYRGLYVLDGAIVPTSLGCNPLWTITALAERALHEIPDRPPPGPIQRVHGAARAPQLLPSKSVDFDARLHEVLLARNLSVRGAAGDALGGKAAARLEATFECDDLPAHMSSRRHEMKARAELFVGPDATQAEAMVKYIAAKGLFEPLPATTPSAGPLLFVRSMLELAALLVVLVAAVAAIPLGLVTVAGWVVLLLGLLLVLPFARTMITWVVLRARRDLPERGFSRDALLALPGYLLALLKQLVHASEKRVMRYRIPMVRDDSDGVAAAWPAEVTLHASKTVMYRASIGELLRWAWCRWVGTPVPLRPTLWEQAMNAQVRVVPGQRPVFAPALLAGTFAMGFDNLTSSGLSASRRHARGAIELGQKGDTSTGLLALASYPLLFLRFALKTRLLDFRLPTYSGTPTPDRAASSETRIRSRGRFEDAQLNWLDVERGRSSGDRGDESTMPLRLPLWRYRQRQGEDGAGAHRPPDIVTGEWMGVPVARAKVVLLLHAFGQSGYSYTLKTVPENLAERFYREGYEVWVLEMRMSTRSGYASDPCCIDQIAEHDVPAAVRYILAQVGQERPTAQPLQIAAFAQCIGAAALWMSLLLGKLSHGHPATTRLRGGHPQLSMLSHAMFSQVHPWMVGARGTQSKTWLPALLQALWRRGAIPFGVRGPQDGVFLPMLDRVLASLPAPAAEDRRPRGNDDAAATCRRIRYIEAPLFRHENIGDDTFAEMNLLFGEANLRLFAHARRFVDRERLVDEDGTNCYLTDENLRHHLAFPLQLLHGADNELFDVESARRSFDALGGFHGQWQQQFCVRRDREVGPVIVPGYGHLDVLIGDGAAGVVFPEVLHFFNRVLEQTTHEVVDDQQVGWVARPPRLGPFVGWLREEGSTRTLRVSFVVDDRDGLQPASALPRILLRARSAKSMPFQVTPQSRAASIAWHAFDANVYEQDQLAPAYRFAWADIPVPVGELAPEAWEVLTLHPAWVGIEGVGELLPRDPSDQEITTFVEAMEKLARGQPIAPGLSDSAHATDFSGAVFRITAESLRSLAAHEDVPFAVASCRHPGFGIDSQRVNHTVCDFLKRRPGQAAFAMLLGDQIYADATAGLVDPTSPLERFYERHEIAFGRGALGQLLAEMPVYMTPDDHEFTDGHPGGAPLVKEPWPDWGAGRGFSDRLQRARTVADKAVTAFQRLQSPLGARARQHYRFRHGCTRFYVFDTRAARQRNEPLIVDAAFLKPLETWLSRPEARDALNVIACGTVVLPGLRINADPANPGGADTWQYAASQRLALLDLLVRLVPGRFLLLSGDYHVSGAMRVLCGQRVVGGAVLAPPLYAPMPYANANPDAVDTGETIELPKGAGTLSLEVVAGGEIARGSGLGFLNVRRSGTGFTLDYERDLRIWEQGRDRRRVATLRLEG